MHAPVLKDSVLPVPSGELNTEEQQQVMSPQAMIVSLSPAPIGIWIDGQGFSAKEQQADEVITIDTSTLEALVHDANLLLDRFASTQFQTETDSDETVVLVHEDGHKNGHEDGSKPSIRSIPNEALPELSNKVRELQKLLFGARVYNGVHC